MMKNLIILIVLVIVIGAFVDLPKGHTGEHGLTDQIIEQSDAIRAVREILKDPNSAMFGTMFSRNGLVCGYVNAKNGFGAYTGKREFMYRKGRAVLNDGRATFLKVWNSKCASGGGRQ
jgi:hypothetical protein